MQRPNICFRTVITRKKNRIDTEKGTLAADGANLKEGSTKRFSPSLETQIKLDENEQQQKNGHPT